MIALDIGGTKLAAAIIEFHDESGVRTPRLLERRELPTPREDPSPSGIVRAVIKLIERLQALGFGSSQEVLAVATTGSVAQGQVTALNVDTLRGWDAVPLVDMLEQATGWTTFVLNDADAAAWGEFRFGAGRGVANFGFVTVSTGIGGGFVLDGTLYQTRSGLHAELGYTLDRRSKQPIELIASGGALDRWALEQGMSGARELLERAEAGEVGATGKLEESTELIAMLLADLRVTLGLERVALGGGLGLANNYLERVRSQLSSLGEPWSSLELVRAELGVDAGLIGVADWAQRN